MDEDDKKTNSSLADESEIGTLPRDDDQDIIEENREMDLLNKEMSEAGEDQEGEFDDENYGIGDEESEFEGTNKSGYESYLNDEDLEDDPTAIGE